MDNRINVRLDIRSSLSFVVFSVVIISTAFFLLHKIKTATEELDNLSNYPQYRMLRDELRGETSTSTELSTAGWKTYRNEQYGFEAKYPPDSTIRVEDGYKQSEIILCAAAKSCIKFLHIDWGPIQNGSYTEIPQKDSPPVFYFYWINTADSREIKKIISTIKFIML